MISRFPRTAAFSIVATLLLASLGFLETLSAENEPLSSLIAYAVIGSAALLGFCLLSAARPDLACLSTAASFAGFVALRAIMSPDGYASRADLYLILAALTVYLIAATIFVSPAIRNIVVTVLLLFGVIHVVVSVVQAGIAQNYSLLISSLADVARSERGAGLYVDPDHLAGLLELVGILGLSLTCWSRWPHWLRVVLAYLTGVCYLGLALTGSRGGYLGGAVALSVFALLSFLVLKAGGNTRLWRYGGMGFALLATAIGAASWFVHQNAALHLRAANTFTVDAGRLDIWQAAIGQWKLDPTFGTGSGTFLFYGREFRPESLQADPVYVHNDYLHLLCEYGAAGGVLFLIFFFTHLRSAWRTLRTFGPLRVKAGALLRSNHLAISIGALCAIASYAIHSAFDFNLHIPANALVVAFVFGMLANDGRNEVDYHASVAWRIPRIAAAFVALILPVQAVRLIPGEYYAEQARVALRDEYPGNAIQFAQKALTFEKHNPNIYSYLGHAFAGAATDKQYQNVRPQLYERALAAFDKARQLAPLDGTYPMNMGLIYDSLGRFSEAEWMYYLASVRDPHGRTLANLYLTHLDAWENSGSPNNR